MKKYYTRACNFYYGIRARKLIKEKKALALNGNHNISFDHIEIISRDNSKTISLKNIKKLPKILKKKIKIDLKNISKRKKNFSNFNFTKLPNIMGVLNLTPDSFSDGGKYNKGKLGYNRAISLYKFGSDIIDIGGESTRPMSKKVDDKVEWNRIKSILFKLKKKKNSRVFRYKKINNNGKRNKTRYKTY